MGKAVCTRISIESRIAETKNFTRITREKEWALTLNGETTLGSIEDFYEVLESIYKSCMKAHSKSLSYVVEVCRQTEYDDGTRHFDRWLSAPCGAQDGIGLYFNPDTRYTDVSRDIYLQKKSLRKDLAYALRY